MLDKKLRMPELQPQQKAAKLQDNRFQALLQSSAWQQLPSAVQKRFSKRVKGGDSTVYVGQITQMRMSALGRTLANILRMIGAPLPLKVDIGTPSIVSVTEDAIEGGQIWTRLYANRRGFPQMIHSAKRFRGNTGLEEYIGFGLNMALATRVVNRALCFESAGYSLDVLGKRFPLPRFLTPFDLVVKHEDIDSDKFAFSLRLTAPWCGELIYQKGIYREEQMI